MGKRKLSKNWAITLKPQYVEEFKKGTKRYEIRRRVPTNLWPGDRLYVVQSNTGGKVVLRMRVESVMLVSPDCAWNIFGHALGISENAFYEYTIGRNKIALIRIGEVESMSRDVKCTQLGIKKAPQWFAEIFV